MHRNICFSNLNDAAIKLGNLQTKVEELAVLKENVDAGLIIPNPQQEAKLAQWDAIKTAINNLEHLVN